MIAFTFQLSLFMKYFKDGICFLEKIKIAASQDIFTDQR